MSAFEWLADGRCATAGDPDLMFPAEEKRQKEVVIICRHCEVRERCLEYALDTRQPHGVWGGKTSRQRRKLEKAQDGL